MKAFSAFIISLLLIIALLELTSAVPSKTLGPHVQYVDDRTAAYYIDNPRLVTYLYIYSHSYMCVKCAQAGELISRTAKEFNGQIYVIAMDAADGYNAQTMARLGIDAKSAQFPIVREFPVEQQPNGADVPILTLDFASLKKRVSDLIGLQSTVKHIDSTNMKKYLSFKESSGPKAVLLTTKPTTPTIWASLSAQFEHKIDFYMGLKTDRKLIKRFDIDVFPSILILRKNEFNQDVPDDKIEPIVFNGQMKAPVIKAFLSLYMPIDTTSSGNGGQIEPIQHYKQLLDHTHDFIPVLSDSGCFEAYCPQASHSGLCVLYVAPSIHEQSLDWGKMQELNYQLEVLKSVQDLHRDSQLNWGIVNGNVVQKDAVVDSHHMFTGVHNTFFSTFAIHPQDYPQIILYSPRKNGFATFLGAFNPDNIHKWIGEIVAGQSSMTPLPSGTTNQAISTTFLATTPTRCKLIYDKRQREQDDLKQFEEERKKASKKGTSQTQTQQDKPQQNFHGSSVDAKDVWSKPYRPALKKGEVREMTDTLWSNVFVKRSVAALLHFVDIRELNTDDQHDILTFKQTVEGLNGMIEGYVVSCGEQSAHVRSLFGIETCEGTILGLKPRLLVTSEFYNADVIEQAFVGDHAVFTTDPAEVQSPTVTFKAETLNKWATSQLFEGIKVKRLGPESDALQNWLLTSVVEPRALIFSKKDDIVLAKALTAEFYGFAQVAIVGADNDSLIHQFQVDSFPAVRLIRPVVTPRPGATHGEMEMKLDLFPVPKNQLYYNAIAAHLDQLATIRHLGANTSQGAIFEPLRKEHPVDSVVREMEKVKKKLPKEEL